MMSWNERVTNDFSPSWLKLPSCEVPPPRLTLQENRRTANNNRQNAAYSLNTQRSSESQQPALRKDEFPCLVDPPKNRQLISSAWTDPHRSSVISRMPAKNLNNNTPGSTLVKLPSIGSGVFRAFVPHNISRRRVLNARMVNGEEANERTSPDDTPLSPEDNANLNNNKEQRNNCLPGMLPACSVEEEERLLREMGWKEDDNAEPLTQDEIKAFHNISHIVHALNSQRVSSSASGGGGVNTVRFNATDMKRALLATMGAKEDDEVTEEESTDDDG